MPNVNHEIRPVGNPDGFAWTGWPPRPVLSIYGKDGRCLHRSRSSRFDLTDALDMCTGNAMGEAVFGMRSASAVRRKWTDDEVHRQAENIRYDLSADGFEVTLECIKGVGLGCNEELLWRLRIDA